MGFWDKLKSGVSQVWQNVKSEAEDIADSVKQQGADAVCEAAEDEYEQQKQSRLREKHIRENSRVCSSCGRKATDEKFCSECGGIETEVSFAVSDERPYEVRRVVLRNRGGRSRRRLRGCSSRISLPRR